MDLTQIITCLVLGMGIGLTIGMTGVGGGVLAVPGIQIFLGLPPVMTVGTASFYAFITQGMTAAAHWRLGNVATRAIGWFLLGALPVTICTGLAVATAAHIPAVQQGISYLIIAVMATSFLLMLRGRKDEQSQQEDDAAPKSIRGRAIACGVIAGLIIGTTSIGGGVLLIPMMSVAIGLPLTKSIGSATVVASVITLTTSLTYSSGGQADLLSAAIMAIGSIPAVAIGARLSVRMPVKALRYAVLSLIVLAAGSMLYRSLDKGDGESQNEGQASAMVQPPVPTTPGA